MKKLERELKLINDTLNEVSREFATLRRSEVRLQLKGRSYEFNVHVGLENRGFKVSYVTDIVGDKHYTYMVVRKAI